MELIALWIFFIIIMTKANLKTSYYILFSVCMFCLVTLYNFFKPTILSNKLAIILLTIPSCIFWYIAFVYNNFLCINPLDDFLIVTLLFFYVYILIYVFWEIN